MNEQFTDYETAKRLKELGMDEICIGFFNPSYTEMGGSLLFSNNGGDFDNWNKKEHLISAPLWQQVEQWLWEEHKIEVQVCKDYLNDPFTVQLYDHKEEDSINLEHYVTGSPITAKNEGIKKAVEYLHEHSLNYALKK